MLGQVIATEHAKAPPQVLQEALSLLDACVY